MQWNAYLIDNTEREKNQSISQNAYLEPKLKSEWTEQQPCVSVSRNTKCMNSVI